MVNDDAQVPEPDILAVFIENHVLNHLVMTPAHLAEHIRDQFVVIAKNELPEVAEDEYGCVNASRDWHLGTARVRHDPIQHNYRSAMIQLARHLFYKERG